MPMDSDNKGFTPDSKTNFYKRVRPDGLVEYMTLGSVITDGAKFRTWANHPTFGLEVMTNQEHSLSGFEPILYVEKAAYDALEARVAGLEALLADKISKTAPEHVCSECGFVAKAAVGLSAHMRSHKRAETGVPA